MLFDPNTGTLDLLTHALSFIHSMDFSFGQDLHFSMIMLVGDQEIAW